MVLLTQKNFRLSARGLEMLRTLQYILDGCREKTAVEFSLEQALCVVLAQRLIEDKRFNESDRAKNKLIVAALNSEKDEQAYKKDRNILKYKNPVTDEWEDWLEYSFERNS